MTEPRGPFATPQALPEGLGVGAGFIDMIDMAQPAAGANASFTVNGQDWLRILAATATVTTDANVANRYVSLDYIAARGVTYLRNAPSLVLTAGTTGQVFQWDRQQTVSEWNTNTPIDVPLADIPLSAGWVVQFTIDNKQVGDQLSAIHLLVERYWSN